MATLINEDCINCGACEPECPNTAIYQGGVEYEFNGATHAALNEDLFYIVPEKCTECVGFFDHEACAAVCPVDCCVPDPNIVEAESVLLSRARELHPEQTFGEDFPSRFKGSTEEANGGAVAPPTDLVATTEAPVQAPDPGPAPAVSTPSTTTSLSIPTINDWEVPINCHRCEGEFSAPFRNFRIGVVFYCSHCGGSLVVNSSMFKDVSRALDTFHQNWTAEVETFQKTQDEKLNKFETKKLTELAGFTSELKKVVAGAKPAGRTHRRLSMFGFQRVG